MGKRRLGLIRCFPLSPSHTKRKRQNKRYPYKYLNFKNVSESDLAEAEIKNLTKRVDEAKELIQKYGYMPAMIYAVKAGWEEFIIFHIADQELEKEGKQLR